MTDVDTAPRSIDPDLASLLMADLLFARRAVRAALEPPAAGSAHHRRPAHRPGGRGGRRGARARPRHRLARARTTATSPGTARSATSSWSSSSCTGAGIPDGGRIPDGVRCLPVQISLGTQLPHAAGLAWGLALRGDPGVVCTFVGDGATSEGDFYEAINLAGVQQAPLIVVCINNGWAISTPVDHQTAASTFAAKGAAAGIPGVRVDGNDVLAVVDAARDARRRAAAGDGPTLLELVTYRMGAHTNSDDPTRYVPDDELRERGAPAIRSSGSRTELRHARARGTTPATTPRRDGRGAARAHHRAPHWPARSIPRRRSTTSHRDAPRRTRRASQRAETRPRADADGDGSRGGLVAGMTMLAAIRETLLDEMGRDERVVLLGEDVGSNGGVFRATDGALERFGPQPGVRHADLGVGDRRRVGRALGRRAGAGGRDPVRRVHHAGVPPARRPAGPLAVPQPQSVPLSGDRAQRRTAAACARPSTTATRWRRRTRTRPGSPWSCRRTRPTPRVCSPVRSAATTPCSCSSRSPATARSVDVPDGDHVVPLGSRATSSASGDDAVVITWGAMVDVAVAASDAALEAARRTRRRGRSPNADAARRRDHRATPPNAPDASWSCTRRRSPQGSAPKSSPRCRRRRSTRSRHRSGGWPGTTSARRRRSSRTGVDPTSRASSPRSTRPSMPDEPASGSMPYLLPDLGEGMTEAELVQWRVAVGDHVTRDQIVAHVQTDKAEVELPVPASGTIVRPRRRGRRPGPGRRPAARAGPRRRHRPRRHPGARRHPSRRSTVSAPLARDIHGPVTPERGRTRCRRRRRCASWPRSSASTSRRWSAPGPAAGSPPPTSAAPSPAPDETARAAPGRAPGHGTQPGRRVACRSPHLVVRRDRRPPAARRARGACAPSTTTASPSPRSSCAPRCSRWRSSRSSTRRSTPTRDEIVYHDACHIGVAVASDDGLVVPVVHDAHATHADRARRRDRARHRGGSRRAPRTRGDPGRDVHRHQLRHRGRPVRHPDRAAAAGRDPRVRRGAGTRRWSTVTRSSPRPRCRSRSRPITG